MKRSRKIQVQATATPPFNDISPPQRLETNKRSGGWLRSLQRRGLFWGWSWYIRWIGWLVGCGGNSYNLGVYKLQTWCVFQQLFHELILTSALGKNHPKAETVWRRFFTKHEWKPRRKPWEKRRRGRGDWVTVWSCDKSVSVCTHRSSGEGFQKHLHKHKVVSEKSRKYTLCNMYNSTKSSNINLHYLVQYEKKTILVGRMNIQWLDSLVCSVYSKVCSLFEQGGHESITQVHITKAASTPNRWVSFCPGLSKLTVSLCSKWWRTWR